MKTFTIHENLTTHTFSVKDERGLTYTEVKWNPNRLEPDFGKSDHDIKQDMVRGYVSNLKIRHGDSEPTSFIMVSLMKASEVRKYFKRVDTLKFYTISSLIGRKGEKEYFVKVTDIHEMAGQNLQGVVIHMECEITTYMVKETDVVPVDGVTIYPVA